MKKCILRLCNNHLQREGKKKEEEEEEEEEEETFI